MGRQQLASVISMQPDASLGRLLHAPSCTRHTDPGRPRIERRRASICVGPTGAHLLRTQPQIDTTHLVVLGHVFVLDCLTLLRLPQPLSVFALHDSLSVCLSVILVF